MTQKEVKNTMTAGNIDDAKFIVLFNRAMTNKEAGSTRLVATKGACEVSANGCFELLQKIDMAHEGWEIRYETLGLSAQVALSSVWAVVYKKGRAVNGAVVNAEWNGHTKTGLDTVL